MEAKKGQRGREKGEKRAEIGHGGVGSKAVAVACTDRDVGGGHGVLPDSGAGRALGALGRNGADRVVRSGVDGAAPMGHVRVRQRQVRPNEGCQPLGWTGGTVRLRVARGPLRCRHRDSCRAGALMVLPPRCAVDRLLHLGLVVRSTIRAAGGHDVAARRGSALSNNPSEHQDEGILR